jgi:hypothetical protein
VHIFGLRLNMYVAIILTIVGLGWFYLIQRRPAAAPASPADSPPADPVQPDSAAGEQAAISPEQEQEQEQEQVPDGQPAEGQNAEVSDGRA